MASTLKGRGRPQTRKLLSGSKKCQLCLQGSNAVVWAAHTHKVGGFKEAKGNRCQRCSLFAFWTHSGPFPVRALLHVSDVKHTPAYQVCVQRRLLEAVWIIHLETLQVSIHGNSPIFSKFLGLRALSCLAHELFLPKVKEWALREPQREGRENLLWTALGEDARTDARTAVYPVCCYAALVAEPCRTKRSWLA